MFKHGTSKKICRIKCCVKKKTLCEFIENNCETVTAMDKESDSNMSNEENRDISPSHSDWSSSDDEQLQKLVSLEKSA